MPWLFGSFLVIGAISSVLIYDTNAKGSFEKSTVGKLLKDAGALPHVEKAYVVTLKYSARGYQWAAKNIPVYYNATSTKLGPYLEVTKDLGKIALNGGKNAWGVTLAYIDTKLPIVVGFVSWFVFLSFIAETLSLKFIVFKVVQPAHASSSSFEGDLRFSCTNSPNCFMCCPNLVFLYNFLQIDQYAPGLPKTISSFVSSTWTNLKNIVIKTYTISVEFFKTKVFV